MSFLELTGLARRYGDFHAVSDVTLAMRQGEFVSLLGPSGCGKTTTLQMIAGFIEPTAGSVTIEGRDLTRVPANRRGIGIVFQSYALFPHMTVAANVAFGLEMRRVPRAERTERVGRALELVHLAHLAGRYPRQLSGGQQQRVALARALVIEPRLLLLDEPMSNLDAKLREDMQIELRRLQRSLGITTIMVTHDQNEAMAMSDRIAVMRAGRIVQIDTPEAAYEYPADDFASTFLGKSNNVPARVTGRSIALPGGLTLALPPGGPPAPQGEVLCSLRPEKLWMTEPGSGQLRATIRSRLFLGTHWLFQVDSDLGELLVYQQNTNRVPPAEGDVVGLDWHASSLRVLPAEPARLGH
ncbi:Spermidine/putrescine import ATP-binding protein PotA [Rhodovastum atsumiense]|uniref:ABC transporter ATP-binding protein n=1 Tax=Rhodovastum atsumiense TaxID=504468 RepID=A0A5M6IQ00_9PROT|nr:ABC transporter ATP-binding protein [Rhodovastum atsumiense]KAA5609977.1 ABC transporter ATP-binding protein [Rhodovastum atsumiense]CAH2598617.1 Spermidine/putrescine import ATP-binding protein PotA [Rhodovastum atsumiense]